MRPSAIVLPLIATILLAAGCGDDEPSGTAAPTAPAATATPGSAGVVLLRFGDDGFAAEGPLRFPAGSAITLVVTSADGRPHGLTVEGAPGPPRVVVTPGETKRLTLDEDLPAGRYRLAPDGATEPLELVLE